MSVAAFPDSTYSSADVLRGAAVLEQLGGEWRSLPQARSSPLLSHDWMMSAACALHAPDSLATIVLREQGEVAAIAPLVRVARGVATRLEIAGSEALHEPAGLLYRDPAALARLCDELIALGLPIVLRRIDVEAPAAAAFTAAARGRGRLFSLDAAAAPYVRIDTDWRQYFDGLSARRRQDYRRARRKLEAAGRVEIEIRHSTPASVAAELAEAVRVEGAGWKSRNGSSLAARPELRAFFAQLAARLAARGALRVCFLRVDGVAIATQLCVEEDNRWWILKIGYDEKWAALSPGIQLMWDVARHAFERGLKSLEMLGSAESWLDIWASERRLYRTLVFYPANARGLAALALQALSVAWRRLRARAA